MFVGWNVTARLLSDPSNSTLATSRFNHEEAPSS
jgi:hypothetical protein